MSVRDEMARMMFCDSLRMLPWKLIETSEIREKILEGPHYDLVKRVATITVQISLYETGDSPDGWPYRSFDKPSSERK